MPIVYTTQKVPTKKHYENLIYNVMYIKDQITFTNLGFHMRKNHNIMPC